MNYVGYLLELDWSSHYPFWVSLALSGPGPVAQVLREAEETTRTTEKEKKKKECYTSPPPYFMPPPISCKFLPREHQFAFNYQFCTCDFESIGARPTDLTTRTTWNKLNNNYRRLNAYFHSTRSKEEKYVPSCRLDFSRSFLLSPSTLIQGMDFGQPCTWASQWSPICSRFATWTRGIGLRYTSMHQLVDLKPRWS